MKKTVLKAGKHYQEVLKQRLQASKAPAKSAGWETLTVPTVNPMKRKNAQLGVSRKVNASKKLNATCNCGNADCPECCLADTLAGLQGGSQKVDAVLVNVANRNGEGLDTNTLNIVFYDDAEGVYVMTKVDPTYGTAVFSSLEDLTNSIVKAESGEEPIDQFDLPVAGEGTMTDPEVIVDEPIGEIEQY